MVAADPNAGIFYICNPNNPTGTLTKRSDIEWALANKPKGSILLLDEAYLHFSDATPTTDLVAQDKEIIVLRTFSKLFGMAGLRAGAAIGRPDLLAKMKSYSAGALPITGMVGADASLKVKTLVLGGERDGERHIPFPVRVVARTREEAEDIWAEARSLSRGERP